MLQDYVRQWSLVADGPPLTTHSSELLPVLFGGRPAMLKLARTAEEARGNRLMADWSGCGAASVYAIDGPAIVLERATGDRSLPLMAKRGEDDQATAILCAVARRLHQAPIGEAELVPLGEWFSELRLRAAAEGGWLSSAATVAHKLLATERDVAVLHGDVHHWNVLDFGGEWRAIDPKGLRGERTFEFANLLRNPDAATAEAPGRLARQAEIIVAEAGVDRERLLRWGYAFAGLSASWLLGDGEKPHQDEAIARIIAGLADLS